MKHPVLLSLTALMALGASAAPANAWEGYHGGYNHYDHYDHGRYYGHGGYYDSHVVYVQPATVYSDSYYDNNSYQTGYQTGVVHCAPNFNPVGGLQARCWAGWRVMRSAGATAILPPSSRVR